MCGEKPCYSTLACSHLDAEKKLNKKSQKKMLPMQKGDVFSTSANTSKLEKFINFKPKTLIEDGISNFIDWYLKNYND